MSGGNFTESMVEQAAFTWLESLGYAVLYNPEIASGELTAKRRTYQEAILPQRLWNAMVRLNPTLPAEAIEEAFRKTTRTDSPSLVQRNRIFHRMLVDGVDVEYHADGRVVHDKARLMDFGSRIGMHIALGARMQPEGSWPIVVGPPLRNRDLVRGTEQVGDLEKTCV